MHDLDGPPRIAPLEREVRQLHRHLGGRFALLARAKEQRLGAVDLSGVDVAARQLEVDVRRLDLHVRAGKALARLGEALLERVGLGERRRVAFRIQAQAQTQEVELDQLRRHAAGQLCRRRRPLEEQLGLLEMPDREKVRRQQAGDMSR